MILPEGNTSYYKLTIFQKTKELVLLIYRITKDFPKEEQFALVSQMRRTEVRKLLYTYQKSLRNKVKG